MPDADIWLYPFTEYMPTIEVTADSAMSAMGTFYSQRRYRRPFPPVVRNQFHQECANDLLLLGRYLKEWDGSTSIRIDDIRRQVFQAVHDDLRRLRAQSPDTTKVLLVLGLFYRFEIPVERMFVETTLELDASYLVKTGEIRSDNDFLLLHHSSMAKLYSNVIKQFNTSDYSKLASQLEPFPAELFRLYVASQPRNLCEMIVGLRRSSTLLNHLLADSHLVAQFRVGLEREPSLNMLGWALVVLFATSKKAAWRILAHTDIASMSTERLKNADAGEVSVFICNLLKVSQKKGEEWLRSVPPNQMGHYLKEMELVRFAATLLWANRLCSSYASEVIQGLDSFALLEKVAREEDLDQLSLAIARLCRLLRGRMCVGVRTVRDFAGEWSTHLTVFCGTQKITRVFAGRDLRIPYCHSDRQKLSYWKWLTANARDGCRVVIDQGACRAFTKNKSLFPVGISEVVGQFGVDDIVQIATEGGIAIGYGVSNYSSDELSKVKGLRSSQIVDVPGVLPNRAFDNDRMVRSAKLSRLNARFEK